MKLKFFIVAVLGLSTVIGKAQPYRSVISTKSLWTSIDCFKFGPFEGKTLRKEMMQGDTVIGAFTYKKMYRDTSATFNWTSAEYVCALREINKQVFYIPADSTVEYMLYDFTKNVGDSVEVTGMGLNYPNPIKLRVDSITTTVIYGVARKTYKFNANGSYHTDEYWYEGIGSSFGFLTPFISVSDNIFTLKCNSKNDTLFYLKSNIGNFLCSSSEPNHNCEYTQISTVNENCSVNIPVYPNPSQNVINFSKVEINSSYEIFSAEGKLMLRGTTNGTSINIHMLPAGMYALRIYTGKNIFSSRFIKH